VNNNGNANHNNASNINGLSPDFARITGRLNDNRLSRRKRKTYPFAKAKKNSFDASGWTLLAWRAIGN